MRKIAEKKHEKFSTSHWKTEGKCSSTEVYIVKYINLYMIRKHDEVNELTLTLLIANQKSADRYDPHC